VSDTPQHRALIRHGETGFICTSQRDFLEKLILLLRDRRRGSVSATPRAPRQSAASRWGSSKERSFAPMDVPASKQDGPASKHDRPASKQDCPVSKRRKGKHGEQIEV